MSSRLLLVDFLRRQDLFLSAYVHAYVSLSFLVSFWSCCSVSNKFDREVEFSKRRYSCRFCGDKQANTEERFFLGAIIRHLGQYQQPSALGLFSNTYFVLFFASAQLFVWPHNQSNPLKKNQQSKMQPRKKNNKTTTPNPQTAQAEQKRSISNWIRP